MKIGKDGLIFGGLVAGLLVMAGHGAVLFMCGGAIVGFQILKVALNRYADNHVKDMPKVSLTISETCVRFGTIEDIIFQQLQTAGDSYAQVLLKFLCLIKAHEFHKPVPPYFTSPIIKKVMYEYKRKYGNLDFPILTTQTVTLEEALTPLKDDAEREDFTRFCVATPV